MADIVYTFEGSVYLNITNSCPCKCKFCIRNNSDSVGDADTLWFSGHNPSFDEIKKAIDEYDFTGYNGEVIFCGYGEPTFAYDNLIKTCKYIHEKLGLKVRLNTNGLSDLLNKKVMLESLRQKGYMSEEMYYTQCKEIDRLLRDTKADRAILYDSELEDSYSNIKELYEIVESYEKEMTHFDEKLFDKIVVDVYIKKDNTIEFKLMGGLTLTERL